MSQAPPRDVTSRDSLTSTSTSYVSQFGASSRPLEEIHSRIAHSATWEEAVQVAAVPLTLPTQATKVNSKTFHVLMRSVMRGKMSDYLSSQGRGGLDALVKETIGSDSERWAATEDEVHALVQYVRAGQQRLEDVTCPLVCVDRTTHGTVVREGKDNALATMLEFYMRKHSVKPSMETMAEAMHLDISWTTALQLLNFTKQSHGHAVPPLMEMFDRTMQLMTKPKSSFGSRPWLLALQLYQEAVRTQYDRTPRTYKGGLDALWRSCDRTWMRDGVSGTHHHAVVWHHALEILGLATRDHWERKHSVWRGEDGCMLAESAVRLFSHSGRWDAAVRLISHMEVAADDATHKMLVPTPVAAASAASACFRQGHVTYGLMLLELFESYGYKWRLLEPETLCTLLSTCRAVDPKVAGHLVNGLLHGAPVFSAKEDVAQNREAPARIRLDRLVSLESLAVVAHPRAQFSSPWRLALSLVQSYDANVWPTQPFVRKVELSAVFRSVRTVIANDDLMLGSAGEEHHPLEAYITRWLRSVFGRGSPEEEWWEDSVAFYVMKDSLLPSQVTALVRQLVTSRPPRHVPFLPISLRHVLYGSAHAIRKSCCAVDPPATDDNIGAEPRSPQTLVQEGNKVVGEIIGQYYNGDLPPPYDIVACLDAQMAFTAADTGGQEHARNALSVEDCVKRAYRHCALSPSALLKLRKEFIGAKASMATLQNAQHIEEDLVENHRWRRREALDAEDATLGCSDCRRVITNRPSLPPVSAEGVSW